MGDMTKCKHGGSVGYCDICSPQDVILNLRERLADAEAALAEHTAEIARLRVVFRVNMLRLSPHHADIDRILNERQN